jgi:GT2 family glycosyltransferase
MKNLITVCIVNYNSSDFILNTLYCLKNITKNSYKVIIRDNNSILKDFLNLKKKIRNYSNVELYRVDNFNYRGSLAHGIAINDLIKKIDTK